MCHNQPHSNSSNYRNGASVTYYQEREPNPQLKGKLQLRYRFLGYINSKSSICLEYLQILSHSILKLGGDSASFKVLLEMQTLSARPNMSTIIEHSRTDIRNRKYKFSAAEENFFLF